MLPYRNTKDIFSFSVRDSVVSLSVMAIACFVCVMLRALGDNDFHVPLIFVLTVAVISSLTNGFFYGIISSVLSVFCVNYVFTYPYFEVNFTISGYPLTFISMLAVSIIICTLTTQIKRQERFHAESEKEKMRSNLLRAISHDLRTPLTSIIGATAAISENIDTLPKEKQLELLADAHEDAQWLIQMVENLLSITRIGEKAAYIKKEAEAIEEVVAEAVGKFKKLHPDITLIVSVPEELFFIPMDAILIEQVIINLLFNSVSHGQYTTEIQLSVRQNGKLALFSVEDNGAGFSDADFPHLFQSYDLPNQRKTSVDTRLSRGIGLSACMSIVKAHGGNMKAENRQQGGAAIEFELPLEEN